MNLVLSWLRTSATSCWCLRSFLIFMILTIAAWINNFLSSSMCLCVVSCSTLSSVFIGILIFTLSFLLSNKAQENSLKINPKRKKELKTLKLIEKHKNKKNSFFCEITFYNPWKVQQLKSVKVPPPPRSMKSIISPLKVSALPKKRSKKKME